MSIALRCWLSAMASTWKLREHTPDFPCGLLSKPEEISTSWCNVPTSAWVREWVGDIIHMHQALSRSTVWWCLMYDMCAVQSMEMFPYMLPYFVMFDWSMTTEFAYFDQPWSAIVILLAVSQGDLNSWDQGLSCVDDRGSKDTTKRCNEYWLNWFWVQCRESVVLWPVWASERTSDKLARKRGKPKSGCDRSLKLWTLQALCLSFFLVFFRSLSWLEPFDKDWIPSTCQKVVVAILAAVSSLLKHIKASKHMQAL